MGVPATAPRRAGGPRRATPSRAAPRPARPRRAPSSRAPAARRAPTSSRSAASRRAKGRRAGAARGPSRGAVARPRPSPALAGAALIPHAAARTAGAVRDISDSSLIVRLTRGRGWIAVLSALLGGIVCLNVISLSLNAGSGRISQEAAQLERANSALRAELAEKLSASRVEAAAAELGLAVPPPEEITYLTAEDDDLERLAKLLATETPLTEESEDPAGGEEIPPAPPASVPESAPLPAPAPEPPAPPPPTGGGATGGVGL